MTLTSPQSWNRYAYVNNNPLSLIDAAGLDSINCVNDITEDEIPGWDFGSISGGGDCVGGSGGGGDNNGDPGNICDADCQLQQAEQNAQLALNDPECAQAVDAGTGVADATLSDNLGQTPYPDDPQSQGFGTITTGMLSAGPSGLGGVTSTTGTVAAYNYDLGLFVSAGFTSTITMNSNPLGLFINPNVASILMTGMGTGYSNQTFQAIEVLHELGHGSANYGSPSGIVPDGPAIGGGQAGVNASMQNTQTIENACFPQGDFGGNQGPVDSPPTDVPAVARPIKHHF